MLLGSYYFYGSWDKRFLILIIVSSLVDYLAGKSLYKARTINLKKIFLGLSICVNLGLLAYFKYYNFFVSSFVELSHSMGFQPDIKLLSIILPVGISFYTFQTMSYTIDIYRGKMQPMNNIVTFFTYVAFFPQLVAGPIERASNLLPQLAVKHGFDKLMVESGLRFILWGLFKKVVIADNISLFVDQVYNNTGSHSGFSFFIATLFFGIQIYCDFSGYSDIAIGSSRLLGIQLMDNFKTPYLADTFRGFWQRWHISLSSWFRDYVYIPIGGNRIGEKRTYINLLVTFMVSGLWHGANFTFIIWGFLHGVYLCLERYFAKKIKVRLPLFLKIIFVYLIVNVTWVFFRVESFNDALGIISQLFSLSIFEIEPMLNLFSSNRKTYVSLFIGIVVFFVFELLISKSDFSQRIQKLKVKHRWAVYYFLIALVLLFGVLNTAPQFIYFQF